MATFSVEIAKSGRSKCKKCKEPIPKGTMRMCTSVERDGADFTMSSYTHVACFRIPRKYVKDFTALEFVQEHVEDGSDDASLLSRQDQVETIAAQIESAAAATTGKKRSAAADDDASLMEKLKADFKAQAAKSKKKVAVVVIDDDDDDEMDQPKKKIKKNNSKSGSTSKPEPTYKDMQRVYAEHCKKTTDEIKDYLRWNRQTMTGTKNIVLYKVLDGQLRGRLPRCGMCGGKLKVAEQDDNDAKNGRSYKDGFKVICGGAFDEETRMRIDCAFVCAVNDSNLKRLVWLTEEPTEEEKEGLDKEEEAAKSGAADGSGEDGGGGKQEVLDKAKGLNWKTGNPKELKATAAALIEFCKEHNLDIPDDAKQARMNVGRLVLSMKGSSALEIVEEAIKKYGIVAAKAAKAEQREAAAEAMCGHPGNAQLLLAFQELAQLYFKEGNRNAGSSYTKAANAIRDLDFEVTADNAMSLTKGKTKVQNIGKSSGEKMKEFCNTGTMQKLEEKRANAA